MTWIAGIGRDDKGRMNTGASPLFDKVNLVTEKRAMTMYNGSASLLFQVAKSYLFSDVSIAKEAPESFTGNLTGSQRTNNCLSAGRISA